MIDKQAASIAAAKLQGCTCEVEIKEEWTDEQGIEHVGLAHDDWCPFLQSLTADNN